MSKKPKLEPRKVAQQSRAENTIEVVLQATKRLLSEEGFLRTTTNRIAVVAGVSIGSLYRYFPNKDSIAAALIKERIDVQVDLLKTVLGTSKSRPLAETVREFIKVVIGLYASNRKLDTVFITLIGKVDQFGYLLDAEKELATLLKDHLAARGQSYKPPDLGLATFILIRSVHSVIQTAVMTQPELLDSDQLLDELTALSLAYLSPS